MSSNAMFTHLVDNYDADLGSKTRECGALDLVSMCNHIFSASVESWIGEPLHNEFSLSWLDTRPLFPPSILCLWRI